VDSGSGFLQRSFFGLLGTDPNDVDLAKEKIPKGFPYEGEVCWQACEKERRVGSIECRRQCRAREYPDAKPPAQDDQEEYPKSEVTNPSRLQYEASAQQNAWPTSLQYDASSAGPVGAAQQNAWPTSPQYGASSAGPVLLGGGVDPGQFSYGALGFTPGPHYPAPFAQQNAGPTSLQYGAPVQVPNGASPAVSSVAYHNRGQLSYGS
jgi:hypothetical protein